MTKIYGPSKPAKTNTLIITYHPEYPNWLPWEDFISFPDVIAFFFFS